MAQVTPMMQQYLKTKEANSDCIVFFRLGDFYEMFFDDAILVSRELELTLTGRDCGLEERAPMCGVPHHSANNYIQKLIEKGYKVAICEQTSDPALSKGLVDREVTRIVTPGTILEGAGLEERANHYLLCVYITGDMAGLAFCDVTTGEFYVHQVKPYGQTLPDEIARIAPSEIITNEIEALRESIAANIYQNISIGRHDNHAFSIKQSNKILKQHFQTESLEPFGLTQDYQAGQIAAGALMDYLNNTQKNALEHITKINIYHSSETMVLDRNTRRNLELTESLALRTKKGSLLGLLDKTATAMGGRMLRSWIEQPLTDIHKITKRQDGVEALSNQYVACMSLCEELDEVYDIERLLSKVAYKSINARDCLALCNSFKKVPAIKALIAPIDCPAIAEIQGQLNPMEKLTALLERAIHPDAPITITEGGIIKEGYDNKLDELRLAATDGKQWILDMEARERELTGIKNLRIQYNRIFGYHIEITKSYYHLVPERYQRKQTLANSERYITPELHEIEQKIMGAQEQSMRLEIELFTQIREEIAKEITPMQGTAMGLKTLDALASLARTAVENQYVRPVILPEGELNITDGRHPVVEQALSDKTFVPNDTHMNSQEARMLIITGPNMAGKSTYMRQVALIALMAHIGSFVPAQSATIPIIDKIFTRVGASDDLFSGKSTFMVEMSEMAYILHNATPQSLIILDEIGRGTSTFDGLAIAWSVVEYICDKQKIGAKTLFATHYHELSELEGRLEGVQNYCISVKEHGEDIIFLRKIIKGGADKSFGVHVARLAGVPSPVLMRAQEIQAILEVSDINQNAIGKNILSDGKQNKSEQVGLFNYAQTEFISELKEMDVMAMTPIDAMNALFLLKEKAKKL